MTVNSLTGQVICSGNGNENSFSYDVPGFYAAHIVYADGTEIAKQAMLK